MSSLWLRLWLLSILQHPLESLTSSLSSNLVSKSRTKKSIGHFLSPDSSLTTARPTFALSSESGPCYVNSDGNSTTINPWSFNNHVNMLYIDQPVQTGFSYSSLINGTIDLNTGDVTSDDKSAEHPVSDSTVEAGTFTNQDPSRTTNNSISSAKALWHFAENWFTQYVNSPPNMQC